MKLFELLDFEQKSAEENWTILNKLERHITIRRIDATITQLVGLIAFYAYAIVATYAMFLSFSAKKLSSGDWVEMLLENFPAWNIFELLPYPWYVTLLIILVGLFAIPWLLALVAKGITLFLAHFMVHERTEPLPANYIDRNRVLAQRTQKLYKKQYNSNGLDTGTKTALIGSIIFGLVPVVTFLCVESTRNLLSSLVITELGLGNMPEILSWLILAMILIVVMVIPSLIFAFIMMCLELLFYNILDRLCRGRKWTQRCTVIEKNAKGFYEQWIAVDPEERKIMMDKNEYEKRKTEERIHAWAQDYARREKETKEYLDRLHKWATEEDSDDWKGSGDGI